MNEWTTIHGAWQRIRSRRLRLIPVPRIDFDEPEEKMVHDNITALACQRLVFQENLLTAVGRQREQLDRRIAALSRDITNEFNMLWRVGEHLDDLILPGE